MRQRQFEAQGQERWDAFEKLLAELDAGTRQPAPDFASRYRRVCQDLALARDRQLSRPLIERLNHMALAGHHHLYRARLGGARRVARFVTGDFARAVRAEWRLVLFNTALFCGIGALVGVLVFQRGQLVYSFMSPDSVAQLESMYDPDAERAVFTSAESRVLMFGFYIWNNVGIAFRTFASGLLLGIGSLLIVGFNGGYFGVVAGHLTRVGSGEPFYTFVVAHGAFELTAILLSGVAGMRLGLALVAPGSRSRLQALRDSAQRALPVVYGAGGMLLIAAAIEAFWSPLGLSSQVKYGVGGGLWALVLLYFAAAGRARAA